MAGGEAGLGVSAVVSHIPGEGKLASLAAKASGLGGAATTFSVMLVANGVILSVVLPLLPYLIWFAALVRYFSIVAESFIYSEIAVLAHMRMAGSGLSQGVAARLWTYSINLLLRPGLMVVGFVFGNYLCVLSGTLLLNTIADAFATAQGNSVTGVITILAFVLLLCVVLFGLVQTCMNAIHEIPDRALDWMGGNGGNSSGATSHAALVTAVKTFTPPTRAAGAGVGAAKKSHLTKGKNHGNFSIIVFPVHQSGQRFRPYGQQPIWDGQICKGQREGNAPTAF
jgi:hypothetical protein